jgi:stage V sporulation protein AC
MAKGKQNNQSVKQKQYQNFAKDREPKRPVVTNCIKAFLVGGLISIIGQLLQWFFINFFHFNEKNAGDPTSAVLIIISILLTGLGVFDHIGQWAGAGTAIPITGFANSMASAAIEHRSEGYVLGTGGNMFKLAGSVITFGVFSAFVVGILRFIFKWLGGM